MERTPAASSDPIEPSGSGERVTGHTTRIERLLARTFLALIVLVVTLTIVERVGVRFLDDKRVGIEAAYPVGFLRRPKPYTMFGGTPSEPFNDLGFPGPSPSRVKQPDEYRVFVLGGSTVVGGNPTLPTLLETEFHRHDFDHVRVFNCGVVSSVSGQELARIVFDLTDYNPDLIVMYNGGNDILEPIHYDPRPGYPFNFLLYEHNPVLESNLDAYPTWTLLAYGSRICRYFGTWRFTEKLGKISEMRAFAEWGTTQWQSAIADTYVQRLVKAERISNAFGSDFIAVFQPMLAFKEPLVGAEIERVERFAFETPTSLAIREKIRAQAERAVQSEALTFVDLSDIYDGMQEQVFRDSIHTFQFAKPIVARTIYDAIIQRTNVRPAERFTQRWNVATQHDGNTVVTRRAPE